MSKPTHAAATCPSCQTDFARLPVEYDEDRGYAVLEVRPCSDATCGKLLCGCCDQFHCDGCGLTFCADHLVSVPDGTENPLHCCPDCAAECAVAEAVELAGLEQIAADYRAERAANRAEFLAATKAGVV
jgi:hypothetical protein